PVPPRVRPAYSRPRTRRLSRRQQKPACGNAMPTRACRTIIGPPGPRRQSPTRCLLRRAGTRTRVEDPGAAPVGHGLHARLFADSDSHDGLLLLAKVIDDDVHEPRAERAILLLVLRFLVLRHLSAPLETLKSLTRTG